MTPLKYVSRRLKRQAHRFGMRSVNPLLFLQSLDEGLFRDQLEVERVGVQHHAGQGEVGRLLGVVVAIETSVDEVTGDWVSAKAEGAVQTQLVATARLRLE